MKKLLKIKHLTRLFLLLAFLLPLIAGCSKGENTPRIQVSEEVQKLFDSGLFFSPEQSSYKIQFLSTQNWTVSLSGSSAGTDWITVTPMSGKEGIRVIEIDAAKNNTPNERSVVVTITCVNVTKSLRVRQEGLLE